MKLSPYRTCEFCRHYRRREVSRDYCRMKGKKARTWAGNGCGKFEALSQAIEDRIRELEVSDARRMVIARA